MKNLKKITFGLVALSLLSTLTFAKDSDMEYQCKSENNPLACIAVNNKIADDKENALRHEYGSKKQRELSIKIEKAHRDAFEKNRKYCQEKNKFFFFSDKKANKINARACQYAIGGYINGIGLSSYYTKKLDWKNFDVEGIIDVAKKGCDMGSKLSCLTLFEIYHPKYRIGMREDAKKMFHEMVKPNLGTAVQYYKKACSPQDGVKPKIFQSSYKYTRRLDYTPYTCKYDAQYLED